MIDTRWVDGGRVKLAETHVLRNLSAEDTVLTHSIPTSSYTVYNVYYPAARRSFRVDRRSRSRIQSTVTFAAGPDPAVNVKHETETYCHEIV